MESYKMNFYIGTLVLATVLRLSLQASDNSSTSNWPQSAGPNYNYQSSAQNPPVDWSVSRMENILWQTDLPEGGQSTPAIWGNRLFVTITKPWPEDADPNLEPEGTGAVGYCLNSDTGKILWSVSLSGTKVMKYAGIYSDSSSPSPITDGEHVWFFNASGSMGCWTFNGTVVWTREFEVRTRHHSRQHEPILYGDTLFYVEVKNKVGANVGMHKDYPEGTDLSQYGTYIHAIDKLTGKVKWLADDSTAVHNTAMLGFLPNGEPAVLHGRGGGHAPLEKPYGLSLTSLSPNAAGQTLWRHVIPKGSSHYTSMWNQRYVTWFDGPAHLVFDATSGELLRTQALQTDVTDYAFDSEAKSYVKHVHTEVTTARKGTGTPVTDMANLLVGDYHYFMSHDNFRLGRVNIETSRVEYVQVPLQVYRENGQPDRFIWEEKNVKNDTLNARGIDVGAVDPRSKKSGWGHVSAATPIAINDKVYVSTMTGLTYVLQADAKDFSPDSILAINDLGLGGHTWSLAQLATANNRIYAHTLKGIICIESD